MSEQCGCGIAGLASPDLYADNLTRVCYCPLHEAAPDLLAALEAAHTWIVNYWAAPEMQPPTWDEAARAAIKKAREMK